MKCFFDENLGFQLAHGLKGFGEDAIHLTDVFQKGTPDEDWLPYVADNDYVLFTRDNRILRRPQQLAIIKERKIGAFFLMGKNMDRWNYIRQIVLAWHKITAVAMKDPPPYAYKVNRYGTEVDKISLK